MTIETMPLALLVEDKDLYPRTQVNSHNVGNLLLAVQAGDELPPPVIDRKSKKIVDGFHRCRMWRRHLGPSGVIEVDVRDYSSDAEIFREAVRLNTAHGQQLHEIERRRITLRLREMGDDDDTIAATLRIPPARVEKILIHTAHTVIGGGELRLEPLKRPLFHLQGQALTPGQVKAVRSAPGTQYSVLIGQLRQALQFDLIDMADDKLVSNLRSLGEAIIAYLPAADPEADTA